MKKMNAWRNRIGSNSKDVNIKEVAAYMGIDTEGKTVEELKEEVQAKLESAESENDTSRFS